MLITIVVLLLGALAYIAYQLAFAYIDQFTLVRVVPDDGSAVITGWELLIYGWPFIALGALLALLVLPVVTRSYRAANHADLHRAIDHERNNAQRAQASARDAHITASNAANIDYAERLRDLSEQEVAHDQAVQLLEAERRAFTSRVEFFEAQLARAAEDVEKADKAKENAMAASARHRKKTEKLKAELEQMTSSEKPADHLHHCDAHQKNEQGNSS